MDARLARIRDFRRLHESGCFVAPNPWSPGSARVLADLGFPALATTSSGFAWSIGRRDADATRDETLAHFRAMTAAVNVPVSGDFQGGFAREPDEVAANCAAAAATGLAGLSIEDRTGDPSNPLFELRLAVERIGAARHALDADGVSLVLTARSEGFIVGRPDLSETIRRLTAYAEAGADCLFAPGAQSVDDIAEIVRAVAPTPVNVLVGRDFTTVARLAEVGVRRISTGGALARTAWAGFLDAAAEIAESGTFTGLRHAVPSAALEGRFAPSRS
jgi:2-methylisocitrate lyase-like PEP mutase family enzyme